MSHPEQGEAGEVFNLPKLFRSLAELVGLHGQFTPPLSENEGWSVVLADVPPLMTSEKEWRIIYVPPHVVDGELYGAMLDIIGQDGIIEKSISLFLEPEEEVVSTMISVEALSDTTRPPQDIPVSQLMAGRLAVENLFGGAAHEGDDVRAAEDRLLFLLDIDRDASPEDLLTVAELTHVLEAWYQR